MSEVFVRPADESDRDILVEMLRRLQDHERVLHPSRRPGVEVAEFQYKRVIDAGKNFGGAVLVAVLEEELVGMIAGWMIIDDDQLQHMEFREHGYISDLFVTPERRGKDIAQHLLYAMEQHLIASGARRLSIGALARNGPAIAAYRTFGFEPFEITLEKYIG
ncbi:MAG: GNAT family N-acetyltransferase [Alphaproteobacteria bacterium]|nr:GNAT family N-acetyltransferase [Alphaproteobacteria bacterium]